MKFKLTLIGLLLSVTAQAEIVCKDCEYVPGLLATYIGSYWPGDRGTFGHHNIADQIGQSRQFDNYFIFDLNNTADAALTFSTLPGMGLDGPSYAVEIYPDTGSVCGPSVCSVLLFSFGTELVSKFTATKRWSSKLELVPGRYVIRFSSGTRASGESAYEGKLALGR